MTRVSECLFIGVVRRFTVRGTARLQGMPDTFLPSGSWSQALRQLGNAVPALLAEVARRWIARNLAQRTRNQQFLTDRERIAR
ncbi:DNA cytosine methyltransferase [Paraburkholderia azotifigens]|uniref:DNA cytosine methyltransferase n=1 Tax=Paraburkholderia azotifigens TaxID=2057004 RepID=A0ABU9R9D7_9BURK